MFIVSFPAIPIANGPSCHVVCAPGGLGEPRLRNDSSHAITTTHLNFGLMKLLAQGLERRQQSRQDADPVSKLLLILVSSRSQCAQYAWPSLPGPSPPGLSLPPLDCQRERDCVHKHCHHHYQYRRAATYPARKQSQGQSPNSWSGSQMSRLNMSPSTASFAPCDP